MLTKEVWQKSITDEQGNLLTGVQISVFGQDGLTPATIYSGPSDPAMPNPFNTGAQTVARFYAAPGLYVVRAFKSGVGTQEWTDVPIGSPGIRDDLGQEESEAGLNGGPAKTVARSVRSIKDLLGAPRATGSTISTTRYLSDVEGGAGDYVWSPDKLWQDHNGVTCHAVGALSSFSGDLSGRDAYLNWSGLGVGCFVLISPDVRPEHAGAAGGSVGDAEALKAYHSAVRSAVYAQDYSIEKINTVKLLDGASIDFAGFSVSVPDGVALADDVGSFGRFENSVYSRAEEGPMLERITFIRPVFKVRSRKVNAIGAPDTRGIRDSHEAGFLLDHPVFDGPGELPGLGGPAGVNYSTSGALIHANGYVVDIAAPEIALGGNSIIAQGGVRLAITGGSVKSAGVSSDLSTWANSAAVLGRGNKLVFLDGLNIDKTGGSSVFVSQDTEHAVHGVHIRNMTFTGCGLSAISAGHRTYAAVAAEIETIDVSGVTIRGFCCAPGADTHSAIKISMESTSAAGLLKFAGVAADVDFLAPWETFDPVENAVAGSYNQNKTKGFDVGNQSGIQVGGSALGAVTTARLFGAVRNHSRVGLSASKIARLDLGLSLDNNGWSKTLAGAAFQIQQSARISDVGTVRGRLDITKQSAGVSLSDGFCTPLFLSNITDCDIRVTSAESGAQRYPVRIQDTAPGKYDLQIKSDVSIIDAGFLSLLDLSTGAATADSQIRADDLNGVPYIITGSRTLPPTASSVRKSDAAGARTVTLRKARQYLKKTIVFSVGATGVIDVSAAAGELINGAATLQVAAGQQVRLYSDGVAWVTV